MNLTSLIPELHPGSVQLPVVPDPHHDIDRGRGVVDVAHVAVRAEAVEVGGHLGHGVGAHGAVGEGVADVPSLVSLNEIDGKAFLRNLKSIVLKLF